MATIHERHIGSVLVADGQGAALGIFTRHDILSRVALARVDLHIPISPVMSTPVYSLTTQHTAHDAALLMSRHAVRHVPVTRDGQVVGLVSERDLFALQRLSLKNVSSSLRAAATVEALVPLAQDIRHFARSLLARSSGMPPDAALLAFERFIGKSPLIAFHAAFDETLILRAFDAVLGRRPANPWLDLEPLAAVLMPKVRARSLDEWMAKLQIRCAVRHQAAADTLATAELLQKLWPAALREMQGQVRFAAACDLVAQRRWMPG